MAYKNSSNFGSLVSSEGSFTPARKVKNNADIFEERGLPWSGTDPVKTPRLSPEGELRMNRAAHLYNLTHPKVEEVKSESSDISFSTEHCQPIHIRLAREQNTLLKSMNAGSQPASPHSAIAVNLAAKLRSKRASKLIKVS